MVTQGVNAQEAQGSSQAPWFLSCLERNAASGERKHGRYRRRGSRLVVGGGGAPHSFLPSPQRPRPFCSFIAGQFEMTMGRTKIRPMSGSVVIPGRWQSVDRQETDQHLGITRSVMVARPSFGAACLDSRIPCCVYQPCDRGQTSWPPLPHL